MVEILKIHPKHEFLFPFCQCIFGSFFHSLLFENSGGGRYRNIDFLDINTQVISDILLQKSKKKITVVLLPSFNIFFCIFSCSTEKLAPLTDEKYKYCILPKKYNFVAPTK